MLKNFMLVTHNQKKKDFCHKAVVLKFKQSLE